MMRTFESRTAPWLGAVLFLILAFTPGAVLAGEKEISETSPASVPDTAPDPATDTATIAPTETLERAIEKEGIGVSLSLDPLSGRDALQEDDFVRVRFSIEDTNTGAPMPSLYPAGWMDRVATGEFSEDKECRTKVASFIGGSFLAKTELDLNVYYVLALNNTADISVVDPLFGFGGSKLLTTVKLPAPGDDWVLDSDGERLFVSMPATRHVAIVETRSWQMVTRAEVPGGPTRLMQQPDGAFIWTAWEDDSGETPRGGVSAVSPVQMKSRGDIETGLGPHDLAVSDDNRFLFVTNGGSGTLSVIDIAAMEVVGTVDVGPKPVAVDYSDLAKVVVVTEEETGAITLVGGENFASSTRLDSDPGLGHVLFAPRGRYAFAVNPVTDEVLIIDAVSQRLIQAATVEEEPVEVAFTEELAYIKHRASENVLMIPLATIGGEGDPIQVVDFPGGTHPPGQTDQPSRAAGIVQTPGAVGVLVANAPDKAIYYYKEGMAAPMGHFKNYGRTPRAVMVVDRSLQEVEPGVYETVVQLRRPGKYDLAFFLDSPRIVHCFGVEVAESPERAAERMRKAGVLRPAERPGTQAVGTATDLTFRVRDPKSGEPLESVEDVTVLTLLAPGIRHYRQRAEGIGDGLYRVSFTPERAGIYYVFAEAPSLGIRFNENPFITFRAVDGEEDEAAEATLEAPAPEAESNPGRTE